MLAGAVGAIALLVAWFVWSPMGGDDSDTVQAAPNGQAGAAVECPPDMTGLARKENTGVTAGADATFALKCRYGLPQDSESAAPRSTVDVVWKTAGRTVAWEARCGLAEESVRRTVTAEGSLFSSQAYVVATYMGDRKYGDPMRRLAARLLAAAEPQGFRCDGAATPVPVATSNSGAPGDRSTPTPRPLATATSEVTTTAIANCDITGRVTDANGAAVKGIRVSLSARDLTRDTATDDAGKYVFRGVTGASTASISIFAEEYAHTPQRFRVLYDLDPAELEYPPVAGGPMCERNFDLWDAAPALQSARVPMSTWPDLITIYQNTRRAWALADVVGADLDYGLPLEIHAWCTSTDLFCSSSQKTEFAFFRGSSAGDFVDEPYIALGHANSVMGARGVPDNREYHEFGHAFFADYFGDSVPFVSGDRNHGGYYANASTTDSWVEGFAEFYSMMVAKYVDMDPAAQRYKIGAEYDLEVDHKPWEAGGWWEEFTLAGLLLDLEDGSADYATDLDASQFAISQAKLTTTPTGLFAVGKVRNISAEIVENLQVTVRFTGSGGETLFTQITAVLPKTIKPGGDGAFYAVAPAGMSATSLDVTPGPVLVEDDDALDLELKLILAAMKEFGDADVDGDGHISDLSELYTAILNYFVGRDRNGDGVTDATKEDIDSIFLAHGFFEDLNGDQKYDPAQDGLVSLTSHPGRKVGGTTYVASMPRHDIGPVPASLITVGTGGIASTAIVQVEYPAEFAGRSYAYAVPAGPDTPVEVAVPMEGAGAGISVITIAADHLPAVALRMTADSFHNGLTNSPSKPFLSANVRPVEGKLFEDEERAPAPIQAEPPTGGPQGGTGAVAAPEPGFSGTVVAIVSGAITLFFAVVAAVMMLLHSRKQKAERAKAAAEAAEQPDQKAA